MTKTVNYLGIEL